MNLPGFVMVWCIYPVYLYSPLYIQALRLITMAQANRELTPASYQACLLEPLPPCQFEGIAPQQAPPRSPQQPVPQQSPQQHTKPLLLDAEARSVYEGIFYAQPLNEQKLFEGAKAATFLSASGLGVGVLKQIWALSDLDSDGLLSVDEFCLAMLLVGRVKAGEMLPQEVSQELLNSVRGGSSGGSVVSEQSPSWKQPLQQAQVQQLQAQAPQQAQVQQQQAQAPRQQIESTEDIMNTSQQQNNLQSQVDDSRNLNMSLKSTISQVETSSGVVLDAVSAMKAELASLRTEREALLVVLEQATTQFKGQQAELAGLATQLAQTRLENTQTRQQVDKAMTRGQQFQGEPPSQVLRGNVGVQQQGMQSMPQQGMQNMQGMQQGMQGMQQQVGSMQQQVQQQVGNVQQQAGSVQRQTGNVQQQAEKNMAGLMQQPPNSQDGFDAFSGLGF